MKAPSKSFTKYFQKKLSKKKGSKLKKQEMVLNAYSSDSSLSSDEERHNLSEEMDAPSARRSGCGYIQQYSHFPDISAFQRRPQQNPPLSTSKLPSLDEDRHRHSERYTRNFTTYDGITARGRRQPASVSNRRDDHSRPNTDRMYKIRNKLNPVRDYRLMDTVHYLAQGEFAPRDDGIKLTQSREAVLSDIIWEDVCRTHWPMARLGGRRNGQSERARSELQRLIDNLLRERIVHVERRRRRHSRIVKLNGRHDNYEARASEPFGKNGEVIVASHKKKDRKEREIAYSDQNSATVSNRHRERPDHFQKCLKSCDRIVHHHGQEYLRQRPRRWEENEAGPSSAIGYIKTPCCCAKQALTERDADVASSSSYSRSPVRYSRVKRDDARSRKHKDEPSPNQYILLPTLVARTNSKIKRQKELKELYNNSLCNDAGNSSSSKAGNSKLDKDSNINIYYDSFDDI